MASTADNQPYTLYSVSYGTAWFLCYSITAFFHTQSLRETASGITLFDTSSCSVYGGRDYLDPTFASDSANSDVKQLAATTFHTYKCVATVSDSKAMSLYVSLRG